MAFSPKIGILTVGEQRETIKNCFHVAVARTKRLMESRFSLRFHSLAKSLSRAQKHNKQASKKSDTLRATRVSRFPMKSNHM
jgi:hypothetical protein